MDPIAIGTSPQGEGFPASPRGILNGSKVRLIHALTGFHGGPEIYEL